MEIQANSNMPQLGTFWRQLRTELGPMQMQHGEHMSNGTGRFEDFDMDFNLGRSCSQMGPSWSQVGPKWKPSGQVGAEVGALLAEVDIIKLGQCCGHVGSKGCIWTMLQTTTVSCTFWKPAPSKMPPFPAEAVPCSLTDLSISLAAKLLRLGTFGAGGFYSAKS